MICFVAVFIDDCEVRFYPDGSVRVDLRTLTSCRHDLEGYVHFAADGTVLGSKAGDAYLYTPLKPHVIRAAENAAWKIARRARRTGRQVLNSKGFVRQYKPDTLEYLVLLAEGKIRKDGWPHGWTPID